MQAHNQDRVKVAVYSADMSETEQHGQDIQIAVLIGLGAVLTYWLSYCL